MSNDKLRVSIGMPVYNGENFIKEAIDSILAQTFEEFELIISDNASTDGTEEICREYADKEQRIRYYRNEQNIGAAPNYNHLVELARGKYFKWAAHDDICDHKYLEKCVKILDGDRSIVLCHTKTLFIDGDGQKLIFDPARDRFFNGEGRSFRKPESPQNLDSGKPYERYEEIILKIRWCFQIFGLIRLDELKKTSLIKLHNGGDKVLLTELSLKGRFAEIPEPLFFRRCHSKQFSASFDLGTAKERDIWFGMNPEKAQGLISTRLLCLNGYLHALSQAEVDWYVRTRCSIALLRWVVKFDSWGRFISEIYRENLKDARP